MSKLPISVLIITLNEERNLPGALDSIQDVIEDVFIVDSLSTDRTVDIALERGVHIVQRPFTNFGDHWNWALEKMPVKTPWTFILAPDERFSPGLIDELRSLLGGNPPCNGYTVRWRLWFMGKPLHVISPVLRLWRTGKCRFSDVLVNEHPLVDGPVGKLKGIIEHHDSPDLHHWWDKQNRYTTMMAVQRVKGKYLSAEAKLFGNRLQRRMFFLRVFQSIPFRYQIQMLHELFIRGAWRDGIHGLNWARLRVMARRMVELKTKEIRLTGRVPEVPRAPHGDFDPRILDSPLQKRVLSQ